MQIKKLIKIKLHLSSLFDHLHTKIHTFLPNITHFDRETSYTGCSCYEESKSYRDM